VYNAQKPRPNWKLCFMYDFDRPNEPPLSIIAPEGTASANPAEEFRARLEIITPNLFVARIVIALNVAVFLAMIVSGVSPVEPTTDSLIRWGADYGPLTVSGGQWWRLLTSMFLHIGIIHIAFNMFVLWQIGPFVERLLGNPGFLIVYLVSGIAGALVSVAWNPYVVSAGASGAIFGLYGALLGFLSIRRDLIPTEVLTPLTRNALIFIAYNVVYGMIRAGKDVAAHLGGLAAGFACGLCLSVPLTANPLPWRGTRNAAVALLAVLLFTGTAVELPRPIDFQAEIRAFAAVERKTLTAYNADLGRMRAEHLRDEQMADLIEKDVIPGWAAERQKLARLKGLKGPPERVLPVLLAYMDARQQAWALLVQSLRQHDIAGVRLAMQKQREAQQVLLKMKPAKP
jgi:rhomboid protease GluP